MARALLRLGPFVALGVAAWLHACGGGGSDDPGEGQAFGGSSGSGNAGSAGNAGSIGLDGSIGGEVESITLSPLNPTIEVVDGVAAPQQFTVTAKYKQGGEGPVTATFTFEKPDLALIDTRGVLTPTGAKGGVARLNAKVGALGASTNVTVKLRFADNRPGLPQADLDRFGTPDATPSATLLYPYDRTVFARGIGAPELMWDGGEDGAKYKISIEHAFFNATAYLVDKTPREGRFQLPDAWWKALSEGSDGSAVKVGVQRLDPVGVAHAVVNQTWTIAPGSLRGTIYYWEVNQGAIVKLPPGASAPVLAFDPGPPNELGTPTPTNVPGDRRAPYWDANSSGKRCVACHTVSRDGSKLVALFSACGTDGQPGCYRPWGAVDTRTETIQSIGSYSPGDMIYSALTPTGSRLVFDTAGFRLGFADPATTQLIPSALDGLTQVAHPQFSPDGKKLAFSSSVAGAHPIEMTAGNLDVMDYDEATAPHFFNRRTIQTSNGGVIGFPSFTPDSRYVVYQRGTNTRASNDVDGVKITGFNELYLVDSQTPNSEVGLARAGAIGQLPPAEAQRNYQPRVNPVAVGGYVWVVFVSPRNYGNRMRAGSDASFDNKKQLWVTAIDLNPKPGQDPSHPAFRLPGQRLESINMDAYWALEACKSNGTAGCGDGYECCSGFCRDQGDGTKACVPPPANACSQVGERCATSADCCSGAGLECVGGFCASPPPT